MDSYNQRKKSFKLKEASCGCSTTPINTTNLKTVLNQPLWIQIHKNTKFKLNKGKSNLTFC